MNSIWNNNIKAFSARFPQLAKMYRQIIDKINSTPENELSQLFPFWTVYPAKNGEFTAAQNTQGGKLQLHSAYNPQREAQALAEKISGGNKKSAIFNGFGLGYHVTALASVLLAGNRGSSFKLILIEPDPGYFFAALCYTDWTRVFAIEKLVLAIGCPVEQLMGLIENSSQVNLGGSGAAVAWTVLIPAFTAHNQVYFDNVNTLIERNKTKSEINAATYEKFASLWAKNSIKNLCRINTCRTVEQLKKTAADKITKNGQFILTAAGPSLENAIPVIKQLQKHMVIVCVETALRALQRNGIEPDFIIITDPQYWAWRHIAGLKAPQSILVCPVSVYPAVFRFKCREIILCSDLFPVSAFYESKAGSFGDLGAGGSVASSAWNLCRELGAREIYTAGLDLSYPAKQTHIKGSTAEQSFFTAANRLTSPQKLSLKAMYSAIADYGENYNEEKVLTDSRMKMFAWWFESRIAACPETKTYTLCPQSLKIPGISKADLTALCNNKKNTVLNKSIFFNLQECSSSACTEADYQKITEEFIAQLKELKLLVNSAIEKCIINGPKLEKELDNIEEQIQKNELKQILILARPSQKYLEEHQSQPPQLSLWQKLKAALELYNPIFK